MITDNKTERPSRIPIRFLDEEETTTTTSNVAAESDNNDLTPEEIGEQSSYEDTTEIKRRIDRGEEGTSSADRENADDKDVAGAPPSSKLPENREDQDTNPRVKAKEQQASDSDEEVSANKMFAELIATRAELRRVESELKKAESEKQALHDRLIRTQADFENHRKRTERERSETYNRTVGKVVYDLLPVIDNLGRAIHAEHSLQGKESDAFQQFLQGVELIYKQLNNVLENLGVKPIATIGQPFDPHVHEAVATEYSEEHEPDTVIEELSRGYCLQDTLIRPAMVKVSTR
jgi:molecular chaperone GrpE